MSHTSRSSKRTTMLLGTSSETALKAGIKRSFIEGLTVAELGQMRQIVRRVHLRHYTRELPDYKCDQMIEGFAPNVREMLIKTAIDTKFIVR